MSRLFRARLLASTASFAVLATAVSAASVVQWGEGTGDAVNTGNIFALTNPAAIAYGDYHMVALKTDGTIASWGYDYSGSTVVPANLTQMVQVSAGRYHSLARRSTGTVRAWGANNYGQRNVPAGITTAIDIASGGDHNLVAKADGTVVAWGNDSNGQSHVPAGLTGVVKVAAGSYHSLALKSNGTVVAWGHNNYGQTSVPAGLTGVVSISAGLFHSVAVKSNGTVVAWGANYMGQIDVPAGLTGVVKVASGQVHNLALKSDGTVVAWGNNTYGQRTVPPTLHGVTDISAGSSNSWAIGRAFTVSLDQPVVDSGDAATGFIDIGDPAPAGGAMVQLSMTGNLAEGIEIPATVTVPAGQTRATFPVVAKYFYFTEKGGKIQATYNGATSATATLQFKPVLATISVTPYWFYGGSPTDPVLKLKLSRPVPAETQLDLVSSSPYVDAASVTIPAGGDTAQITLTHSRCSDLNSDPLSPTLTFKVHATGEVVGLVGVLLYPIGPTFALPTTDVPLGGQITGVMRLYTNVRNATTVALTSDNPAVTVPASVTVPAGGREVTFPITGAGAGSANIKATLGALTASSPISVVAAKVTSIELPAEVPAQRYFIGTVRLNGVAPVGGLNVQFASSD
ncbi:hypothetical protein EON79_06120, partial [bacterium]